MRQSRYAVVVLALLATVLAVARPALASDARGADPLPFGKQLTVDTSGYGVDADEPGTTVGISCGPADPVRVARTAWYRFDGTGGPISLTTEGSTYDTVLAIYRQGATEPVVCNDDSTTTDLYSTLTDVRTTLGTRYEVQVGAACPPFGACPSGVLHLLATRPRLTSTASMAVRLHRAYTGVSRLTVSGAPKGSRVEVGCTGCGRFTHKAVKSPGPGALQLGYLLKGLRLKAGAKVAVAVTRPGYVGNLTVFAFRSRQKPTRQTFCLEPGSSRPQASCS